VLENIITPDSFGVWLYLAHTGKTVHKYGLNGNTVWVRRTEDRRSQTDADLHGIRLRSPWTM